MFLLILMLVKKGILGNVVQFYSESFYIFGKLATQRKCESFSVKFYENVYFCCINLVKNKLFE